MSKKKQRKQRKQRKPRGLGSINPSMSDEQYTETEVEQMGEGAEAFDLEMLKESNHKVDHATHITLGHPDYQLTDSEVECIVKDGCKGATSLKKAIYYTWLYGLYKREPYNCKTIVEFVGRYFGLSKATFYRQLNQVLINHEVHGEFGGKNYICDFHCQKLSRYSNIIEERGETLKSFWDFIINAESKGVTSERIEKYALLLGYSGHLMTIEEGKALNLPLHKLVDESIPKVVKELNKEADSGEESSARSKGEEKKETTESSSGANVSDLQDILFDSPNDNGAEGANRMKDKKQIKRPEFKRIVEADEFDIAMVSCQANYSPSLEKVVNPLIKLVNNKKLKVKDLMELQNIIDIYLNDQLKT